MCACRNGAGTNDGLRPESRKAPGHQFNSDPQEVRHLIAVVDRICNPETDSMSKKYCLKHLCVAIRPQKIGTGMRRIFIQRAVEKDIVNTVVNFIERGGSDLAVAACNFLADFTFGSDLSARIVLEVFDRIAACFKRIFEPLTWDRIAMLESAVLLCVNIAAMCHVGHQRLVPLVQPVCVQIIRSPRAPDELRGNAITLLANLSMTVGDELRALRVVDVLLDLICEDRVPAPGRSVAESVVIYLHGSQKCKEIDKLMSMNVVAKYCVPLMERTLKGEEFRGMYPHLVYSAALFQVLAQSREYAEALLANDRVVPLLLQVSRCREWPRRVESDLKGRRLALEALSSLAHFGLWPPESADDLSATFCSRDLPLLFADSHPDIRGSATKLWACLHKQHIVRLIVVGRRLEGQLPPGFWDQKVLPFLFPFLTSETKSSRSR